MEAKKLKKTFQDKKYYDIAERFSQKLGESRRPSLIQGMRRRQFSKRGVYGFALGGLSAVAALTAYLMWRPKQLKKKKLTEKFKGAFYGSDSR